MTSRGLKEKDFEQIGEFLALGVQIALDCQAKHGKKLVDFNKGLAEKDFAEKLATLKSEVEKWAGEFFMPGH